MDEAAADHARLRDDGVGVRPRGRRVRPAPRRSSSASRQPNPAATGNMSRARPPRGNAGPRAARGASKPLRSGIRARASLAIPKPPPSRCLKRATARSAPASASGAKLSHEVGVAQAGAVPRRAHARRASAPVPFPASGAARRARRLARRHRPSRPATRRRRPRSPAAGERACEGAHGLPVRSSSSRAATRIVRSALVVVGAGTRGRTPSVARTLDPVVPLSPPASTSPSASWPGALSIESTVDSDERSKAGIAEDAAPETSTPTGGHPRSGETRVEPLQNRAVPSFCAFTERATTTPSAAPGLPRASPRRAWAQQVPNGVLSPATSSAAEPAAEVGQLVAAAVLASAGCPTSAASSVGSSIGTLSERIRTGYGAPASRSAWITFVRTEDPCRPPRRGRSSCPAAGRP